MSLAVVLPPEYENAIFERLVELNRKAFNQVKEEQYPGKRYFTQKELMKFFSTGQLEIDKWRMNGLPRVRKGGSWLYDIEDVYKVLEKLKEK